MVRPFVETSLPSPSFSITTQTGEFRGLGEGFAQALGEERGKMGEGKLKLLIDNSNQV
jgi:hypothetical protein